MENSSMTSGYNHKHTHRCAHTRRYILYVYIYIYYTHICDKMRKKKWINRECHIAVANIYCTSFQFIRLVVVKDWWTVTLCRCIPFGVFLPASIGSSCCMRCSFWSCCWSRWRMSCPPWLQQWSGSHLRNHRKWADKIPNPLVFAVWPSGASGLCALPFLACWLVAQRSPANFRSHLPLTDSCLFGSRPGCTLLRSRRHRQSSMSHQPKMFLPWMGLSIQLYFWYLWLFEQAIDF